MESERRYTREEIEELAKKDPKELTSRERSLVALLPTMNKKGQVLNPNGRKKGTKNWSTHFKKLMDDENFLDTIISQLPKQWEGVVEKYPASVIAAGLIASTTQSVAKAIAEGKPIDKNTLEMIDRIQKIGYGDSTKVELDASSGLFNEFQMNFVTVPDRQKEDES